MNIAFFGASVTQQRGSSSYFDRLEGLIKVNATPVSFFRFGYGSCHLTDAGRYAFKEVFTCRPDVIFFEWHTTGLSDINAGLVLDLFSHCLSNNILLILLVLPKKELDISALKYAMLEGFPYLSLDLLPLMTNLSSDLYFRDSVHTSDAGATVYAEAILKYVEVLIYDFHPLIDQCRRVSKEVKLTFPTSYFLFDVSHDGFVLNSSSSFEVTSNVDAIFSFMICKGPRTPDILVETFNSDREITSSYVWSLIDQWCYYSRSKFEGEFEVRPDRGFRFSIAGIPNYQVVCPRVLENGLFDPKVVFIADYSLIVESIWSNSTDGLTYRLLC